MWRLVKYLEENQLSIVENINARKDDGDGNDNDDLHKALAKTLSDIWPGKNTKDSSKLANAVMTAMWLGRRAQEIKDSGDKSAEQFFREAILMAFETGRRSAIIIDSGEQKENPYGL